MSYTQGVLHQSLAEDMQLSFNAAGEQPGPILPERLILVLGCACRPW